MHRARVQPMGSEPVAARHGEARMREAVSRGPIGREQQQAGGHDVEPSNVRETGHLGEQVEYGAAPRGVATAHDVADRLVQGEPRRGHGSHGAPVHGDANLVAVSIPGIAPLDLRQSQYEFKLPVHLFEIRLVSFDLLPHPAHGGAP